MTSAVVRGASNGRSAGWKSRIFTTIPNSRNFPISIPFRKPKADARPPPAKMDRMPKKIANAKSDATDISVPVKI